MSKRQLMLGNEAIARGLVEGGCGIATSYPGTPASEILGAMARFKAELELKTHVQWAVNEKVAFEIAYAGCMAGVRAAVSMKQVGLNVASDALMSAAYMGTKAGFVIISADDPGPHSSQTEQDSRMMAMMAKIPVLDPDSPQQARDVTAHAFELSERFRIPVMVRPTTRVCHARQDIALKPISTIQPEVAFEKDPGRWAATPKFRFQLHGELEEKLARISGYPITAPFGAIPDSRSVQQKPPKAILASGVAAAHAKEVLQALGLWQKVPFFQILQPWPLASDFVRDVRERYTEILVLEETTGVIEMQIADHQRVRGKMDGSVPRVGELLPERIESIIADFTGTKSTTVSVPTPPGRRPTLCAGCPHRASFFAIKKAVPKGIYTSDIGCYTLGLNLGAVDTVLCMGAAISQAAGFFQAYKHQVRRPDIVATIGDSTFFHAGVPALMDAVVQRVSFVLVILDNRTTAMTGNQPTPATGSGAEGEALQRVDLEAVVSGCGVGFLETADPYQLDTFIPLLKKAVAYSREQGPAVVIARHPCLLDRRAPQASTEKIAVTVTDACDGCGYCLKHFECPALVSHIDADGNECTVVDQMLCSQCGVCLHVCPKDAIVPDEGV